MTDLYSTHPLAKNANEEHKQNLSKIEIICAGIVKGISSPTTLIAATVLQLLWIMIGQVTKLDPYPFAFLLTISNVLQLILIFVIAVGQSMDSQLAETRANTDHEAISHILHHQDIQEEMLLKVMKHLDLDTEAHQERIQGLYRK